MISNMLRGLENVFGPTPHKYLINPPSSTKHYGCDSLIDIHKNGSNSIITSSSDTFK